MDDEDMAFKQKQMAGTLPPPSSHTATSFPPVAHAAFGLQPDHHDTL
jgi:hypothetical protein